MVGEVTQLRSREQSGSSTSSSGDLVEVAMGVREQVRYSGTSTEVCVLTGVSVFSIYQSESNLHAIDFSVKAGEVVGVAGVVGSGQTMLAEVLAGVATPYTGSLNRAPGPIAYIPENRHRDALALSLSIRDNLIVHMHKSPSFAKGPWLRRAAIDTHIADTLSSSRVHGAVQDAAASSLSGGNQQKLVLGRELEQRPVLLVAHNPFRGLDVRAIQDVRDAINAACRAGCGVVMISSDLDELAQLAHRIVVLFAGRLVGEVDLQKDGSEALGRLIGGVAHDGAL
jgi:general nucleoside transport system ATP-binding protein